ncbi:hypothetical protein JW905_00335 [bacterium]|nr:hypothetical protein [candidate division CSSED10-310 bacterium]
MRARQMVDAGERQNLLMQVADELARQKKLGPKELSLYFDCLERYLSEKDQPPVSDALTAHLERLRGHWEAGFEHDIRELYILYGDRLREAGKLDAARDVYKACISSPFPYENTYPDCIMRYISTGLKTIEDVRYAVSLLGHSPESESGIIAALEQVCRVDESTTPAEAERLLEFNQVVGEYLTTFGWPMRNRAVCMMLANNSFDIMVVGALLQDALNRHPADRLAASLYIVLALREGNKAMTLQRLKQYGPALFPDERRQYAVLAEELPKVLNSRDVILQSIGDPNSLLQCLESGATSSYLGKMAQLALGRLARLNGDYRRAVKYLEKYYSHQPLDAVGYYELIRANQGLGRRTVALELSEKALQEFEELPVELVCLHFELHPDEAQSMQPASIRQEFAIAEQDNMLVAWLIQAKVLSLQHRHRTIPRLSRVKRYPRASLAEESIREEWRAAMGSGNDQRWRLIQTRQKLAVLPKDEVLYAKLVARLAFEAIDDFPGLQRMLQRFRKQFPHHEGGRRLELFLSFQDGTGSVPALDYDDEADPRLRYLAAIDAYRRDDGSAFERWKREIRLRPRDPKPWLYMALLYRHGIKSGDWVSFQESTASLSLRDVAELAERHFLKAAELVQQDSQLNEFILMHRIAMAAGTAISDDVESLAKTMLRITRGLKNQDTCTPLHVIRAIAKVEIPNLDSDGLRELIKLFSTGQETILPFKQLLAGAFRRVVARNSTGGEMWAQQLLDVAPDLREEIQGTLNIARYKRLRTLLQASAPIASTAQREVAQLYFEDSGDPYIRLLSAQIALCRGNLEEVATMLAPVQIDSPDLTLVKAFTSYAAGDANHYQRMITPLLSGDAPVNQRARAVYALVRLMSGDRKQGSEQFIKCLLDNNQYLVSAVSREFIGQVLATVNVPHIVAERLRGQFDIVDSPDPLQHAIRLAKTGACREALNVLVQSVEAEPHLRLYIVLLLAHITAQQLDSEPDKALDNLEELRLQMERLTPADTADARIASLSRGLDAAQEALRHRLLFNGIVQAICGWQALPVFQYSHHNVLLERILDTDEVELLIALRDMDTLDHVWLQCTAKLPPEIDTYRALAIIYRDCAEALGGDQRRAAACWERAEAFWTAMLSMESNDLVGDGEDRAASLLETGLIIWFEQHAVFIQDALARGDESSAGRRLETILRAAGGLPAVVEALHPAPEEEWLEISHSAAEQVLARIQDGWFRDLDQRLDTGGGTMETYVQILDILEQRLEIWPGNEALIARAIHLLNDHRRLLHAGGQIEELLERNDTARIFLPDHLLNADHLVIEREEVSAHMMWLSFSESDALARRDWLARAIAMDRRNTTARRLLEETLPDEALVLGQLVDEALRQDRLTTAAAALDRLLRTTTDRSGKISAWIQTCVAAFCERGLWREALPLAETLAVLQPEHAAETIIHIRRMARDERYHRLLQLGEQRNAAGDLVGMRRILARIPPFFIEADRVKALLGGSVPVGGGET